MQSARVGFLLFKKLINHPENAVAIDGFGFGEFAQVAIAGEKSPSMNFGERERKAIRQGQG